MPQTRLWCWLIGVVALLVSMPVRAEPLKIGPLHVGMTFSQVRAAAPEMEWKRRDFNAMGVL